MPTYVRGGGAAMRLVFLLLNLCGVSAAELVPGSVAFVTTSDCKGVTNWRSHGGSGAQFPASLASLMRMKEVFPTWDGFLITSQWKQPACTETFEQFQRKYAQTFQGAKLGKLVLNRNEIKVLDHIASSGGKETDHSRGHWPMEAYMHLVAGPVLLERWGYEFTVYVDPDCWPFDNSLAAELHHVKGIGVIAALPPRCILNKPMQPSRLLPHLRDEYRLMADPKLLNLVWQTASLPKYAGAKGYTPTNTTNSGLVVYNNVALRDAHWSDWLDDLFQISPKGFYGDQTALSVAMGRNDVHIHWLHPKFNVPLTLPFEYVAKTCSPDALYSRSALDGAEPVSFAHFIWGPKPWLQVMNARKPSGFYGGAAIATDWRYVNPYRTWLLRMLGREFALQFFHPAALELLNDTSAVYRKEAFRACNNQPDPCEAFKDPNWDPNLGRINATI